MKLRLSTRAALNTPFHGLLGGLLSSALATIGVGVLGCVGNTPITPVVGPPVIAAPTRPSIVSPAHWKVFPGKGPVLTAKLELGREGVVYVGATGDRWFDRRDESVAESAAALLPEPAVGVIRQGEDFGFVSQSGSVFVARTPLGAITTRRDAKSILGDHHAVSVAVGKTAILLLREDGECYRSTDLAVTWTKVSLPAMVGLATAVVFSEAGIGLIAYAPQRFLASMDDGKTFANLPSPGIGMRRVFVDVNGDVVLEGMESSAALRTSPLRLEKLPRTSRASTFDLPARDRSGAAELGVAVARGQAAFSSDRYYEVAAETDDATSFRLSFGVLDGKLESRKLGEIGRCDRLAVGGNDLRGSIELACDESSGKKTSEEKNRIHLFRSDDQGKTFRDDGFVGSTHSDEMRLFVGPDGTTIVSGACKRTKSGLCLAGQPVIRIPDQKAFAHVGVDRRISKFTHMAFGSGENAYAFGRSGSDTVLLASKNGGRDFKPIPIPLDVLAKPTTTGKRRFVLSKSEPMSLGHDGKVLSASVRVGDVWAVFHSVDEGATFHVSAFPHHADAIGMVGNRGFAVSRSGQGYETTDAGVTWVRMVTPRVADLVAKDLSCTLRGCLLGERAVRLGWGGETLPSLDSSAAKPTWASTMTCSVEDSWSAAANATVPVAYDAVPSEKVRWMSLRQDRNKGSVSMRVMGKGDKTPHDVVLFGPAPTDSATASFPQIEGGAAIRVSFKREAVAKEKEAPKDPKDPKDPKPPKVLGAIAAGQKPDVEVAWWTATTGKVHHATLRAVPGFDARDVVTLGKDAAQLLVGMVSTAEGGIHVRPFASHPETPFYFLGDGGKIEKMNWPDLPSKDASGAPLNARTDALRVDGKSVVLSIVSPGMSAYMAWAGATAFTTQIWGLLPEMPSPTNVEADFDFAIVGGVAHLVAHWPGTSSTPAFAFGAAVLKAESDPSRVLVLPTQALLATDNPRGCVDSKAPRTVAPATSTSRHPVVVRGEPTEIVLTTAAAAIRGDEKSACLDAFEAHGPAGSGYDALVFGDNPGKSLLIRTEGTGEVAFRPMSCTFGKDPTPKGLE